MILAARFGRSHAVFVTGDRVKCSGMNNPLVPSAENGPPITTRRRLINHHHAGSGVGLKRKPQVHCLKSSHGPMLFQIPAEENFKAKSQQSLKS